MSIMSIIKSADPGLSQGRGGAWDHRRCGTTALSNCTAKASGSETFQTVPGSISKLLKLPEAGRPLLQLQQQAPEAVSVSFYGGSRLRSDSLENSPNPPAAPRGRGRPVLGHGRLFL